MVVLLSLVCVLIVGIDKLPAILAAPRLFWWAFTVLLAQSETDAKFEPVNREACHPLLVKYTDPSVICFMISFLACASAVSIISPVERVGW
jgi:hypothetical protein